MEASMRPCSWRSVHLLILVAVAAVAPGCPSTNKTKAAPNILEAYPTTGTGTPFAVPPYPLIVFQFDRPMDPNFINASYFGFADANTNVPVPFQLEYSSSINEVRIIPTTPLTPTASYNIWALPSIQSAAGTQMGSSEGITVTVKATNVSSAIAGFTPTATTGTVTPGDIVLDWSGSAVTDVVSAVATAVPYFDIYLSTDPNGVEYMANNNTAPYLTTGSSTVTLNLPQHNTTYYFKIIPRDSEGNVLEIPLNPPLLSAVSLHN
jgi:hypothetical protein